MALGATIFKVILQISDLDRQYYGNHTLTIALHPSETETRMIIRLLAFALHANESLLFTRGLSSVEEPDLWQKSLTGELELWIDLGQPDGRRLRQACGRARRVVVVTYGDRAAEAWWQKGQAELARLKNLTVINLSVKDQNALAAFVNRTMELQITIDDGHIWMTANDHTVEITQSRWQG
ncbi:MAG: YaeQ family protein [Proteobacteria bacterium]|nr:YaeQ family protein [Pseudomonadota bacterium]MBU1686630.1 YaeQ family protein [Pseudomonadota bacterium]